MTLFWMLLLYTSAVSLLGVSINKLNKKRALELHKPYNDKSVSLFFVLVTFAFLLIIVGCRSEYNDTYAYIAEIDHYVSPNFSDIPGVLKNSEQRGKSWTIMEMVFKHFFGNNYTLWFFFVAIFELGAIIKLYYKFSANFFYSAFLFITSASFVWLMGGIRQFFAVCLVLYFIEYLIEGKTIKFFIVILIACTFHISAIIWIPVYFICQTKPWSVKFVLFMFIVIIALFFLNYFTTFLDEALTDTAYAGLAITSENDDGVNPFRVLVSCVPWGLAFIRQKDVSSANNRVIDVSINMSISASALYLVGMFTSGIIVGRMPVYFTLTNFVLLPWLLENTFKNSAKFVFKFLCIAFYIFYFYYSLRTFGIYGSKILEIGYY